MTTYRYQALKSGRCLVWTLGELGTFAASRPQRCQEVPEEELCEQKGY